MLIKEGSSSINFIDKNDVYLGYETEQSCCEDAGYAVLVEPTKYEELTSSHHLPIETVEGYIFDTSFDTLYHYSDCLDKGQQLTYKLISEGKPDLYLTVYNSHNGYYSHGIESNINGDEEQYCI